MYRPGGFPEYSPREQALFDMVQGIVRRVFEQRAFQHIWTPAVESTDILLKGGETVANEIFGLVGLKDFEKGDMQRAKKSYALHFDLTVPFARYTIDHVGSLVFPFKRYQMQPVWRGERQQRGRFKEFWQCDVDTIWRSGTDTGFWYGVETIATLQEAIRGVFSQFHISTPFVTHISHIGLTKTFLSQLLDGDQEAMQSVVELLDKFYKKKWSDFLDELHALVRPEVAERLVTLIEQKDYQLLKDLPGYEHLAQTIATLEKMGYSVCYDITIVRGLGYYTDIVFETFLEGEVALGSICSGGGYQDFTKFIDPKQVFSGIGGSIGISRVMELILSQQTELESAADRYLFLNFAETFDEIVALYSNYLAQGKVCELYPTEAKFGKQLEYASKKGYRYAIILGTNERDQGHYQIKDLMTGEVQVQMRE